MAVSAFLYDKFAQKQLDGSAPVVWSSDTIKVALLSNAHTPNQATHDFFDDVSANEITGTGYTAGGVTLASKTSAVTSHTAALDAADTQWTGSTLTARYAVIYQLTGTASTSKLIGLVDFGADVSTTSGTFTITWAAAGIATFNVT